MVFQPPYLKWQETFISLIPLYILGGKQTNNQVKNKILPETKTISTAAFLALEYAALTIQQVLGEWEEFSIQQIKEQLQTAKTKLKQEGVI